MTERPERTEDGFTIVYSKDDLPVFESERQEHDFWSTHVWSEELMDEAAARDFPAPPIRKRSTSTALRLDEDALKRLSQLARKKGKGYQTLLKEFVVERLYEEEKREGVLDFVEFLGSKSQKAAAARMLEASKGAVVSEDYVAELERTRSFEQR